MVSKFEKGKSYVDNKDNVVKEVMMVDEDMVAFIAPNRDVMFLELSDELLVEFSPYNPEEVFDLDKIDSISVDMVKLEDRRLLSNIYVAHFNVKKDVDSAIIATKAVMHELFK